MLNVQNLAKSFGNLVAVDHISFEMSKGEIFGFLGPNGAGKTTTINMICGLLTPDAGSIFIDGEELDSGKPQLRKKLGIVPQEIALYEDLNAYENLAFWGRLYSLGGAALKKRMDELLQIAGLQERAKDRVKTYSGGMKRRLNMIAGMLHRPELLLLDEPTVGIDPQARHNILQIVRDFAAGGAAILYTTHYLDEAESLCDRLAIIDHGRILAAGSAGDIKAIVGENSLIKLNGSFTRDDINQLAVKFPKIKIEAIKDGEVILSVPGQDGTGALIEEIIKSGVKIDNLQIKEPSLDSAFIKLTGRELRD